MPDAPGTWHLRSDRAALYARKSPMLVPTKAASHAGRTV